MAHTVAQQAEIAVGTVFPPGLVEVSQPGDDLSPGPWQERANHAGGGSLSDTGKCARSATSQQLHENPLGHVITVVAGCYGVKAPGGLEIEECLVPKAPPRALSAGRHCLGGVKPEDVVRDFAFPTEILAECGIFVGFVVANAVVDMCRFQGQFQKGIGEQPQQSNRVGAPGQGDQNPRADQFRKVGFEVV